MSRKLAKKETMWLYKTVVEGEESVFEYVTRIVKEKPGESLDHLTERRREAAKLYRQSHPSAPARPPEKPHQAASVPDNKPEKPRRATGGRS